MKRPQKDRREFPPSRVSRFNADKMPQSGSGCKRGLVRVADALAEAFRRVGLTFTQGAV